MQRIDQLVFRALDGDAGPQELRTLSRLIEDGGAETAFGWLELESHLRAGAANSVSDRVVAKLDQERRSRIEEAVVVELEAATVGHARQRRRRLTAIAAVAVSTLLLGTIAWSSLQRSADAPFASLIAQSASVQVRGSGQHARVVNPEEPFPLRGGETVFTHGTGDAAEIRYQDGTRIELLGAATLTIQSGPGVAKQLELVRGAVHANVAPQPAGYPLRVNTSTAALEVIGTTLGVEASEAATQLDVSSGVVALTRRADGNRIEVAAGQYARATPSSTDRLQPVSLPPLERQWDQDFEAGLPTGWWAGKLQSVADRRVVLAWPDFHGTEHNFAVTTQNAWREGEHALFALAQQSVLHVRFKQQSFAPLRIMLVTRSYPRIRGRFGTNLYYEDRSWNQKLLPDQWKTISVPLARVSYHGRRNRFRQDDLAIEGLAAYQVQVSTLEENVGLQIDRLWVTCAEDP